MRRPLFAAVALALLAPAAAIATTYTVTTTADDGPGSLRAALLAAGNGDLVAFDIAGEGVHEIFPQTALPPIAGGVTLDALTQTGASCAAWPPVLRVELRGDQAPPTTSGLTTSANDVTIRGLAVSGWNGNGIVIGGSFALVECSFVGTDASGTLVRGNDADGIRVTGGAESVIRRNLVSGNTIDGVRLAGAADTLVAGNWIGPDASGALTFPNGGPGIELRDGANGSILGTPSERNRIVANGGGGIVASGASTLRNDFVYNELARNGTVGIDLFGTEFSDPNDAGDGDEGPNRLQNTPVPSSAEYVAGTQTLTVQFLVDTATANAAYPLTVAVYRADADQEEGEELLGVTSYGELDFAAGVVTRVFAPVANVEAGDFLVAVARDALGNTSEYSFPGIEVTAPEPGSVACGALALAALAVRRRALRSR